MSAGKTRIIFNHGVQASLALLILSFCIVIALPVSGQTSTYPPGNEPGTIVTVNNNTSLQVVPPDILRANYSEGRLVLWWEYSDDEINISPYVFRAVVGTCPNCNDVINEMYGHPDFMEHLEEMMMNRKLIIYREFEPGTVIFWSVHVLHMDLQVWAMSHVSEYEIPVPDEPPPGPPPEPPPPEPEPPCEENWTYGEWSRCFDGWQYRHMIDLSECGTKENLTMVRRTCEINETKPNETTNEPSINQTQDETTLNYSSDLEQNETMKDILANITHTGNLTQTHNETQNQTRNETYRVVEKHLQVLEKGIDTVVSINETQLALREVWIKVSRERTNVSLSIQRIPDRPPEVTVIPAGEVYQYVNISRTNLPDADVERGMINFEVRLSWIGANKVNRSTVVLRRLVGDRWVKLNTSLVGQDGDFAYYRAFTPGFSYFSIVAQTLTERVTDSTLACIPMDRRCSGGQVQQCSIEGDQWMILENCQIGCSAGECLKSPVSGSGEPGPGPAADQYDGESLLYYFIIAFVLVLMVMALLVTVLKERAKKILRDAEIGREKPGTYR